jgi:hypothetical protein
LREKILGEKKNKKFAKKACKKEIVMLIYKSRSETDIQSASIEI